MERKKDSKILGVVHEVCHKGISINDVVSGGGGNMTTCTLSQEKPYNIVTKEGGDSKT